MEWSLYAPKRGCRDSDLDTMDVVGEYQAECNLERFRKPPRRNWKLDE